MYYQSDITSGVIHPVPRTIPWPACSV